MANRDKISDLMKRAAPYLTRISDDVNTDTTDKEIDALIMALETHKASADHDGIAHIWTALNRFLQAVEVDSVIPTNSDSSDIGSSTRLFRKGFFSELSTLIFKKENVLVMDGIFVLTKQSGKFDRNVLASDTTIDFGQAMTPGDFLLLRSEGQMEFMQVGSLVNGTIYNVTRNLDGSGANDWPAGSVFAVLGNQGDGRIEFVAGDEWRFSQIVQGSTYNSGMETVRIGKLDGWQASTLSGPGIVIGDWSTGNYLYYSQTTGKWVFKLAGGDVIINTETGIELKPGRALKFLSGTGEKIAGVKIVFPGGHNNCPTLSLEGLRDSGADAAANMRASGTGKDGIIEVNPGNIYARVNSNLSGAAKMDMAVTDPNGTNGVVLDSAQINLGKKVVADNITATPTADGIIKAKADGKADIGWIPDLSSLYLGKTGKASDADKLDGLDSSAFLQTPSWTSWTPTQSGWTALPTGTYRYFQVGKMCFFAINITAGTSNSNLAVLSLPVAAKSGTFWGGVNGMAMNNGTVLSVATKWYIDASTGNITFGTDMGSGLWATSGTKRIRCEGFYEIA